MTSDILIGRNTRVRSCTLMRTAVLASGALQVRRLASVVMELILCNTTSKQSLILVPLCFSSPRRFSQHTTARSLVLVTVKQPAVTFSLVMQRCQTFLLDSEHTLHGSRHQLLTRANGAAMLRVSSICTETPPKDLNNGWRQANDSL